MSISILIADDHQVLRDGLRAILDAEPDFHVVAEASDGLEAVQSVAELHPDVLVLDLTIPSIPGLEVITQAVSRSPATKIVVLSMHEEEAYVLKSLRNGASGYVVKSAGAEEVRKAIRAAVAGVRYLSPPFSEASIGHSLTKTETEKPDLYETLTLREREVLYLIAEGLTNRETAERLQISRRTVEAHRARLMMKLRIDSQAALVRYAVAREVHSSP